MANLPAFRDEEQAHARRDLRIRLGHESLNVTLACGEIDRVAGAIKATHPDFRYQPIARAEELVNDGQIQRMSAALVRRQFTPELISSLPRTAGLPPFSPHNRNTANKKSVTILRPHKLSSLLRRVSVSWRNLSCTSVAFGDRMY